MALIGAQMYTARDFCKANEDIAKSCERVKKMGYDGIQASAAGFNTISADDLNKILADTGLTCAATHRGLLTLDDDQLKAEVEYHQALNCKYAAIGGFFPGKDEWTIAKWEAFCEKFNQIASHFAGSGVQLGYHNHSHEFALLEDGKTRPVDLMLEKLDPSIWFEWDVYWVQHGGADPAVWIEKVAGRIPCIHYKDMTITCERQHKMCEVGSGNMNWPAINAASAKAGVEWYLVERDSGDLDPFESLEISVKNLRSWGL